MTVYLIRNKANGKCYVGKTTRSLRRRWYQHKAEARLNRLDTPLYCDMGAFQLHCFEIQSLGETDNQRRLNQLERRFIRIFKAVEKGYNQDALSHGGRVKFTREGFYRPTRVHRNRIAEGMRRAWADRKAAGMEGKVA